MSSYKAEISRTNPSCFLFLVDQSGSMTKPFGGAAAKSKAQGVADAINRLLQNLVLKCAKSDGIRDYFYVGVIGYGAQMGPAFGGALAGKPLAAISEVANKPLRVEQRLRQVDDGAGGLVEQKFKFPVWFEPVAAGKTPMCGALKLASQVLGQFLKRYPECFPPVVLNITDGAATDGKPQTAAATLNKLRSRDGAVLLFNAHLSSRSDQPIEFPDSAEGLADPFAQLLFGMSSLLPARLQAAAKSEGYSVSERTRGFVFNADLVSVIRFMDIGTKVAAGVR